MCDPVTPRLCVVMPAHNEGPVIDTVVRELHAALSRWSPDFIVIDDASSDDTESKVRALVAVGMPVTLERNTANRGHGPTTLRALTCGLDRDAQVILAMDSDGEFPATAAVRIVQEILSSEADVVEGMRRSRRQPWFRRFLSIGTCVMVWARCGRWPGDANTPLRAYRPAALRELLSVVPETAITPNLLFSAIARSRAMHVRQVMVEYSPVRRAPGSTWRTTNRLIPNSVLICFCLRAVWQWLSTPIDVPRLRTTGDSEK